MVQSHAEPSIGCVIMASGLGKRFGDNKLMADFHGRPLISNILDVTGDSHFIERIVVTRHQDVQKLCHSLGIPVLLHDLPGRNDTIHLGLSSLMQTHHLDGCLFTVGDQPFLTSSSLNRMLHQFSSADQILRLGWNGSGGNPVLFGSYYFDELLHLPSGKGGGVLIKKYPENIQLICADSEKELADIDTVEDLQKYGTL